MADALITVNVGDDDLDLLRAIRKALKKRRARKISQSSGIAGHVDYGKLVVMIRGTEIVVECETWQGTTISGPRTLVEEIAQEAREAFGNRMRQLTEVPEQFRKSGD